ncbi:ABC transporter substrate-binding protein [Streptosporangium soli]|nr:ABC transporter substrate-binding protein [Streptosporangium sp. KLBMP 9127]
MRRHTPVWMTVAVLALAGCTGTEGSSGTTATAPGMVDFLDYGDFGGGTAPQANYNPYLDATRLGATDYMYEKLMVFDNYSCTPRPWLATGFEWTDPRTLVLKLRSGVKWTDGQTLTAEDVAFSYQLIKKHEALDTQGLWNFLSSVEATGESTITMKFDEPGASVFTMAINVPVVPEHTWSKIPDPVTFVNTDKPVSSGPYTVKAFNPQQLTIERNPAYWQADKIKVQEIRFHKADGGGPIDQLKLSRGEYDHNAMFVPDVKKAYVDRDPEHNHYWYPPGGTISAYLNLTRAPFDDVAFRKALTTAFDHQEIIEKAQLGYVDQASQTGLIVPAHNKWLPAGLPGNGLVKYDAAATDAALTAAGYRKDGTGRRLGKDGKPIAFTFKVPGTYTDWVAAAEIVVDGLKAQGFDVAMETPDPQTYEKDRAIGDYDALFGAYGGSCNMYRNLADPLSGDLSAPIGKKARSNYIRWHDKETDRLLEELRVATDEATQKEAIAGVTKVMMEQVPMIPLWYGAKWYQYQTDKAIGWPEEKNPYASPGDNLLIITNLRPTG